MTTSYTVKLHVYDLSGGMARALSPGLVGRQIVIGLDGIWHTAVVVYGMEWFYGQGILFELPGQTQYGSPIQTIDMGNTEIPPEIFREYIDELREIYTMEKYHLLDNNCNNFTNDVCQFLTGRAIPESITTLPADFLTTPLGQQLRPIIESMFGQSRYS
ncbi:11397_t:CDS:2 [Ambispora gerdemannii]|uniref:11397_t:CDS:1 n=1 Tax=Ambispora gerdemannii TaxID=144530 RepID=A0A9N8VD64_9GLOM|nr:11397_t:CDS:2 [Ambispora gerdemannii]